jgi:hypothetical protein
MCKLMRQVYLQVFAQHQRPAGSLCGWKVGMPPVCLHAELPTRLLFVRSQVTYFKMNTVQDPKMMLCGQGTLAQLDTRNPVLYIEFPEGRLKFFGTIVFPHNKYMVLKVGTKDILCEDVLESMVRPPN